MGERETVCECEKEREIAAINITGVIFITVGEKHQDSIERLFCRAAKFFHLSFSMNGRESAAAVVAVVVAVVAAAVVVAVVVVAAVIPVAVVAAVVIVAAAIISAAVVAVAVVVTDAAVVVAIAAAESRGYQIILSSEFLTRSKEPKAEQKVELLQNFGGGGGGAQ